MLEWLSNRLRKSRLVRYKKKKVISSMTLQKKNYFVTFTINIDDEINPQEGEKVYEMVVPARAAFYARLKAKDAIKRKISLGFKKSESMTDEEVEEFIKSREEYQKDIGPGDIVND